MSVHFKLTDFHRFLQKHALLSQVDNQENLLDLGSLVRFCPAFAISRISPSVAKQTASNPVFVKNLRDAPVIVRERFVKQVRKCYIAF